MKPLSASSLTRKLLKSTQEPDPRTLPAGPRTLGAVLGGLSPEPVGGTAPGGDVPTPGGSDGSEGSVLRQDARRPPDLAAFERRSLVRDESESFGWSSSN